MDAIVRIEVSGGVASVTTKSAGVKLQIFDWDNAKAGDGDRALMTIEADESVSEDSEANWR
jgi:hypothetical protein